jgi:hypothetical protein
MFIPVICIHTFNFCLLKILVHGQLNMLNTGAGNVLQNLPRSVLHLLHNKQSLYTFIQWCFRIVNVDVITRTSGRPTDVQVCHGLSISVFSEFI